MMSRLKLGAVLTAILFATTTLEDATGITQFRTIDRDGSQRIYDLGGRQLSTPTKGVNIINGQKVLINR